MGQPAVVSGDRIMGQCAGHQVPSPSGAPMPAPAPLPFSAPVLQGTVATVLIAGKPAAVEQSAGLNTPPHLGLHASDPFLAPPMQRGVIVKGSATVLIGGRGAAYSGCMTSTCFQVPGQVTGSATTVLIGP
jgi:uncharacterized Zn-binding protein involved in type VI secretion